MNYLLDTHTLIWAIISPEKLSKKIQILLQNTENNVFVSTVSFWEIALKSSINKMHLENFTPEDFLSSAIETGFNILPLDAKTSISYHKLMAHYHRDPFDRMLIWVAIQNNYQFISKDENVQKYVSEGLKVIW